MGRLELQFSVAPVWFGNSPVNREPRCGVLRGQLLYAEVKTTDWRANLFRLGVCTGSGVKLMCSEYGFSLPKFHCTVTHLIRKNVDYIW